MKIIPNYHPPSDYRRPTKTQEKVYVPVNDYPEINFSMITNPLTLTLHLFLLFVLRSFTSDVMQRASCGGLGLPNTNSAGSMRLLTSLNPLTYKD